jgi:hypothetical protein
VKAFHVTPAHADAHHRRPDKRQLQLTAVCMAAQNQIDLQARGCEPRGQACG